jgi:hypothetical protein
LAATALTAAKEAAKDQGNGDLVDKAKAAVTSAVSAVKDEAKREVKEVGSKLGVKGTGAAQDKGTKLAGGSLGTSANPAGTRPGMTKSQPGTSAGGSGPAV